MHAPSVSVLSVSLLIILVISVNTTHIINPLKIFTKLLLFKVAVR